MHHLRFSVHIAMVKSHVNATKKSWYLIFHAPHFLGFIHAPDEYTPFSKKNEISFNTIFDWVTLWFHVCCVTRIGDMNFYCSVMLLPVFVVACLFQFSVQWDNKNRRSKSFISFSYKLIKLFVSSNACMQTWWHAINYYLQY